MIHLHPHFKLKHRLLRSALLGAGLGLAPWAAAQNATGFGTQTVYGTTGLLTIPSAEVLGYGRLTFGYNNFLNPQYQALVPDREGQNYLFGAGVFPGLEVFGRLAEVHSSEHEPHVYGNFDSRDLIGNLKYRLPLPKHWPALAVGVQDAAGLAVKERRYYAVSTYQTDYVDVTLGYAKMPDDARHTQMLDGVFGGLDLKLASFAKLQLEHDGLEQRAGVALNWQKPLGWDVDLYASGVLYSSLNDEEPSFSVGLSVPLLGRSATHPSRQTSPAPQAEAVETKPLPSSEAASEPTARAAFSASTAGLTLFAFNPLRAGSVAQGDAASADSAQAESTAPNASQDTYLASWASVFKRRLQAAGFEQLTLAYDQADGVLHLAYQNRGYAHGDFAALGAMLKLLAQEKELARFQRVELLMLQQDQPRLQIGAEVSWLQQNRDGYRQAPTASQFSVRFANRFNAQGGWLAASGRDQWLDIELSPAYKAFYGHEYDVWDYSLALRTNLKLPLWQGANASFVHESPVDHSYNFDDDRVFADSRHQSRWTEVMLHQTLHPWPGLLNTTSFGRLHVYDRPYNALTNTTRWYGFEGRHQLYAQLSELYGEEYGRYGYQLEDRSLKAFGYEFLWSEQNLALNYEYGQYYEQDKTSKLTLKSFLGKATLNLQYVTSDLGWDKVGVGLSFPLWTAKKFSAGPLSVSGDKNWNHQIVTTVDDPDSSGANLTSANANYVNVGLNPWLSQTLHVEGMEQGRLTPDYIQRNLGRLF